MLNIRDITDRLNDTSKNYRSIERLNKELKKWEYYLKIQSLLGNYEKINKYDIIVIQYDNRVKYKNYIQIVDYCNKGLISLKDSLCFNKFGVTYTSLSPLDSSQNEIKEAIDFVYPNMITSTNFEQITPPPPNR